MAAESTRVLVLGAAFQGDAAAVLADALIRALAVEQGEQSVVASLADARPGADRGPALADQDRARVDHLASEDLHPEPLGVRVPAVAGGPAAFLMSHLLPSPRVRPCACGSASGSVRPRFPRLPPPARLRTRPPRRPRRARPSWPGGRPSSPALPR